jgi:H+/Cl- antiporter ClcA
MGIELFGSGLAVPLALACVVAYLLSGHRGIYAAQRIERPKWPDVRIPKGTALRDVRRGTPH